MKVTYTIEMVPNQFTSTEPTLYKISGVGYGTKYECEEYLKRMNFENEKEEKNTNKPQTWRCCGGVELLEDDKCPVCGDKY